MKKIMFVLLALVIIPLCGCDKEARPDESGETSYIATGWFTREGFTYTGLDVIFYGGRIYSFMPGDYLYTSDGMEKIGEVNACVDAIPENDYENSRDLDAGTALFMYPDDIRYIFAQVPGKSPGDAGTAYCYFNGYSGGDSLMADGITYFYEYIHAVLPRDAVLIGKISSVALSHTQNDLETAFDLDIGTELYASESHPGSVYAKSGARRLDDDRGYILYSEKTQTGS